MEEDFAVARPGVESAGNCGTIERHVPEQNYPQAQTYVGLMYVQGRAVPPDPQRATFRWLILAGLPSWITNRRLRSMNRA